MLGDTTMSSGTSRRFEFAVKQPPGDMLCDSFAQSPSSATTVCATAFTSEIINVAALLFERFDPRRREVNHFSVEISVRKFRNS